jgi:hypothetical protein
MASPDIPLPPGLSLEDLDEPPENVGTAEMAADGTLTMHFRTETRDGMIGEMTKVVRPGEKDYAMFVAHLGGLRPGQGAAIPPFAPPEVDPDSV